MGVRRRVIGGACLLVALSVTAVTATAANAAGKATTKPKIDFVCATATFNSWFAPFEQGAKDAAKELGVNLTYTGLQGTFTPAAQAQIIQAAVDQHPDVLIDCDFVPTAGDPVIRAAIKQGIPVITSQTALANGLKDGSMLAVGTNNYLAGQQAGRAFLAKGVKHPLCVNHAPTVPELQQRCQGLASVFKAKGINTLILNMPTSIYSNTTAQQNAIKGELASHSNVDGVFVLGPQQAVAAVGAAAQLGKSNKITIGTVDMSSQIVNDVKSGKLLFAIWEQPYLTAYMSVVWAAEYARHQFLPPTNQVYMGPLMVTKANIKVVELAIKEGLA